MPRANRKSSVVKVAYAEIISPHSKALYESGKKILIDTIDVGREFCKYMIQTSLSAIAVFLGVLTFLLPEKFVLGIAAGGLIALPAIGFLIASILFSIGYLPSSGSISLNDLDEIESERLKLISRQLKFIWSGSTVFILSILGSIYAIIKNIGVK